MEHSSKWNTHCSAYENGTLRPGHSASSRNSVDSYLQLTFSRTSSLSVSKNWCKALQKRRKECSLWNRNTHIKRNTHYIMEQEHSLKMELIQRNTHQKEFIKRNTHIIKRNSLIGTLISKRNTHYIMEQEHSLKMELIQRNTHQKEFIKRNTHIIKRNSLIGTLISNRN